MIISLESTRVVALLGLEAHGYLPPLGGLRIQSAIVGCNPYLYRELGLESMGTSEDEILSVVGHPK